MSDNGELSFIDKLNKCSKSGYINFDKLEVGAPYKIIKFGTMVPEKHNDKNETHLIVIIEDGYLILPTRFNSMLEEYGDVSEINTKNMYIIYNGRDSATNNKLDITFKEM